MSKTVIAFDLYGTLLSTESISRELAKLFGDNKAKTIAAQARRYQLEYTWRSNSMRAYRPFNELTRHSFRQATSEVGVTLSPDEEQHIMNAYNGLDSFPDAQAALPLISAAHNIDAWVFSNGTKYMVSSSLQTSVCLSEAAAGVLGVDKILSVDADTLKVYKPDRRTYEYMMCAGGAQEPAKNTWLVSSNPFDALGAVAAGMKSAWVDRGGSGWNDGLAGALDMKPTIIVKGVDEAVKEIIRRTNEQC